MKYMLIMRASDEGLAKMAGMDFGEVLDAVGKFNDERADPGWCAAGR